MFNLNEIFYQDSYLKEYDTKVVRCVEEKGLYKVVLEETIFYPEGGGQSCDLGKIGNANIVQVKREKDEIVHYVDTALESEQNVHLTLDWARRYDHMQNHTGEHILSGIIQKLYGYENVGFHMDEEKIQADYDGVLTAENIEEIESKINEVIHQNIPVVETYPSNEELVNLEYRSKKELTGKVRIISIDGVDICACCGTHVKSTAEVNLIKILSFEKHKTGTRIEMKCGVRAFQDYKMKHDQNTELFQLFSSKPDGVASAVKKQNEEYRALQKQFVDLANVYLNQRVESFKSTDFIVDILDLPITVQSLREYVNALTSKASVVCVLTKKEDRYFYLLASQNENVSAISKKMNQVFNGKGGGKDHFAQGSIIGKEEDLEQGISTIIREREGV